MTHEPDPFDDGRDVDFGSEYPEGYEPGADHEPKHKTKRESKTGPKRGADLHKPFHRLANERFPGCFIGKLEGYRYAGGNYVKSDFCGFGDFLIQAKWGVQYIVQVTTESDVDAHLVKYTSASKTFGPNKTPIGKLLREFLQAGGRFYIVGMYKGKKEWKANWHFITEKEMDECAGRSRGRVTA